MMHNYQPTRRRASQCLLALIGTLGWSLRVVGPVRAQAAGAPAGAPATGAPAAGPATGAPGAANSPTGTGGSTGGQSSTAAAATNATAGAPTGASSDGGATAVAPSVGGNSSLPLAGTASDSPTFDLDRTIRGAISSSAALIQAQRNVEIDRRRADEIAGRSRPSLTADGSATRFDAPTQVAFGPQKVTVIGNHTEALSINASERVDLLGTVRAENNQARLQTLADTFTLTSIRNERILRAQMLYFSLLRGIHQVSVAQTALRNAVELQTVANRLFLGQIGQKIDVLRANTQAAQAQQNLTSAENNRDIARASFNDLVGRPLTAPVVVVDVPGVNVGVDIVVKGGGRLPAPTVPVAPGGAALAPTVVGTPNADAIFQPFAAPIQDVNAINVDQAVTSAQAQRPEILQQATLLRASDIGARIARSGLEPSFSVSASGNYFPTLSFQNPRKRTAALTVAIAVPLYDGGVTRDRIAEARLQTLNARTTLDSTKEDVALQVRQDFLNLATAARQIEAANVALQQAVGARQLAQVRYEGQVGLYLEVTDAQAALVQAENAQVDAVYNYLISRAQFENALGTPPTGNTPLFPVTPVAGPGANPTNTTTPAVPTPAQP